MKISDKTFRRSIRTALILVYLVIVAGATVRMTGSGMGCPDWPKCFGYIIPPTEHAELEWKPINDFDQGQVIIKDSKLFVAQTDFKTENNFKPENWSVYKEHDYATFNPSHTWTEYINRLFGALAGLAVLIMAILSLFREDRKRRMIALSWICVFLMGFQAWLGAQVVYSVLEPLKITIHMIAALGIVALILVILYSVKKKTETPRTVPAQAQTLGLIFLILILVQIVLGTQVRQFIDAQVDKFGYDQPQKWLSPEPVVYMIHPTFSIAILLFAILSLWQKRRYGLNFKSVNWIFILVLLEMATGILMAYADFPFSSQALHLVLASILFGSVFYWVLQLFENDFEHKIT